MVSKMYSYLIMLSYIFLILHTPTLTIYFSCILLLLLLNFLSYFTLTPTFTPALASLILLFLLLLSPLVLSTQVSSLIIAISFLLQTRGVLTTEFSIATDSPRVFQETDDLSVTNRGSVSWHSLEESVALQTTTPRARRKHL